MDEISGFVVDGFGNDDGNFGVEIAGAAVGRFDALAFGAESRAAGRASWDFQGNRPMGRGNVDLRAERSFGQRDGDAGDQVEAVAAKARMWRDADGDQQIAGRAARVRGFALAAEAKCFAAFDAGGDFDADRFDLAAAAARYVQADFASHHGRAKWHFDLMLHVCARLTRRAARTTPRLRTATKLETTSAATRELAEQILEFRRQAGVAAATASKAAKVEAGWNLAGPLWTGAAGTAHLLELGSELVVHFSFFVVAEDVIGLLYFLEFLLGGLVVRIHVRMVLARKLAVGLLDFVAAGAPAHAEPCIIVVAHEEDFRSEEATSAGDQTR